MAKLENFKDLFDLTLSKINKLDYDEQIENNVKASINNAYNMVGRLDKRVTTAYIPIINGLAIMPDDIDEIVKSDPSISGTDKIIGNSILTEKTGIFNIVYSYIRQPLTADDDIPEISTKYLYPMCLYACYDFYNNKKKGQVAQDFLIEYNMSVEALQPKHSGKYKMENIFYDGSLGGDY